MNNTYWNFIENIFPTDHQFHFFYPRKWMILFQSTCQLSKTKNSNVRCTCNATIFQTVLIICWNTSTCNEISWKWKYIQCTKADAPKIIRRACCIVLKNVRHGLHVDDDDIFIVLYYDIWILNGEKYTTF